MVFITIKLGIIGSSAGNGHPYSWSAIFNGYDAEAMQSCEYPIIHKYLGEQSWPESRIPEAQVSSIWTQNSQLSKRIALSSCIYHVSASLDELQGRVDAILLARDDAENHLYFARQFLLAGMPIYIDKPIALSLPALFELYQLQQYPGQIFTCSALRYSYELILSCEDKKELGEVVAISASTPKSWEKYAVHIIEPVLKMIMPSDSVSGSQLTIESSESRTLNVWWDSGLRTSFSTLGDVESPIQIKVDGTKCSKTLIFKDSFTAFKMALQDYINGILYGDCRSPFEFNSKVVDLIMRGMR